MPEKRELLALIIILNSAALSSAGSLQWFPSLAADDDVYIAWADERNGNYTRIINNMPHKSGDIYLAKGGIDGFFGENIRINEVMGSTGHGSPAVALDRDNIYVVWEDDRYGFEELYFTFSDKNYLRFEKDTQVVRESKSEVLPSIAALNGTVYIAMMNKKTWDIEFTEGRIINGVYMFDEPVRVNDDAKGWHYAPSIAIDDENNVCIAWLDSRNSDYDIYFSHGTRDAGWKFSTNVRVNDDAANASQYTPSIAFENGTAYVAWYDDRNRDFDIYISRGGVVSNEWKFDANVRVNDEINGSQMHPSIALKNGEIFAVWEDESNGASSIYFSSARNLEFISNTRVSNVDGRHYDPQIGVYKDIVYIAWQAEHGSDSGDIYFSAGKYSGKSREFGKIVKVNDDLIHSAEVNTLFLMLMLGAVIAAFVIAGVLRRYER